MQLCSAFINSLVLKVISALTKADPQWQRPVADMDHFLHSLDIFGLWSTVIRSQPAPTLHEGLRDEQGQVIWWPSATTTCAH